MFAATLQLTVAMNYLDEALSKGVNLSTFFHFSVLMPKHFLLSNNLVKIWKQYIVHFFSGY